MTNTLAVVGAGVIGLSAAWRAAAKGHAVTVYDPEPVRGGASWLAGGMLAPVTEAWPGEEDVLALGEESLRRWPGFAADLKQEGVDPGLAEHGTLVVAFDSADAGHLDILMRPPEVPRPRGRTPHRARGQAARTRRRVRPKWTPRARRPGRGQPETAQRAVRGLRQPPGPVRPRTRRNDPGRRRRRARRQAPGPGGCTRGSPTPSARSRARSSASNRAAAACRRRRGPSAPSSKAGRSTSSRAATRSSSSARRSTKRASTRPSPRAVSAS